MDKNSISACYFPTTVVFVDDNRKFLDSISLGLNTKTATYQFFDNPHNALSFLTKDYTFDPFLNHCLVPTEDNDRDHKSFDVDIAKIHQEIYNANRFQQVSVVVIDYAMPGINGGEFSKQLKDSNFKIILLTGEADQSHAVKLFNDNVIHYFIRKDDMEAKKILNEAIARFQLEYFADLSSIIIKGLTQKPSIPELIPSSLTEPKFIKIFNELVKQKKITEYYLIDETGSYLFLDENGKVSWLIVQNEGEMGATEYEILDNENIDPNIRKAVQNKELLAYFFNENDYPDPTDAKSWRNFLYPATKIEGENNYYYSYIEKPLTKTEIDTSKIVSYSAYLDKK